MNRSRDPALVFGVFAMLVWLSAGRATAMITAEGVVAGIYELYTGGGRGMPSNEGGLRAYLAPPLAKAWAANSRKAAGGELEDVVDYDPFADGQDNRIARVAIGRAGAQGGLRGGRRPLHQPGPSEGGEVRAFPDRRRLAGRGPGRAGPPEPAPPAQAPREPALPRTVNGAVRAGRPRRALRQKQPRERVSAGSERQRLRPGHRGDRQRAVEMGKQRAAARGLPPQRLAQRLGLDGDEQKVPLPRRSAGARSRRPAPR